MSKHFSFDGELEPVELALLKAPWAMEVWRPSLPTLPAHWYNPGRYRELSRFSFVDESENNEEDRKRKLDLWREYEQVTIQYERSLYNNIWEKDHRLRVRFFNYRIIRYIRSIPERIYASMYKSWIFYWVKVPFETGIIHAEELDDACIKLFRNIQERNSEVLTEVVERLSLFVASTLSLAGLIYLIKSGVLIDKLGLDIINGVLVRKY
ncbi:hypothetical protein ACG74X_19925 [Marivita sp. S0852]|uniref:hypothetical protein n=1 Tax=Marivita sp. S0852 TaxID=3373893 RepID=UPI0039820E6D